MNFLRIIFILVLCFSSGCQSLPSVSTFENKSITQDINQAISAGEPYEKKLWGKDSDIWNIKKDLNDPVLTNYFQSVMDRIWPFYKDKAQHYYVRIDQNSYVQSLIILPPGNQVYISYSLLNVMNNEDELACLLAHEIGHVVSYGYEKEQGLKRTKPGVLEKILDMTGIDGGLKAWATRQKNEISLSQISQEIEMKADLYGSKLAVQAGYDPFALCDLLNRLAQLKGDNIVYQISQLKGTHPSLSHRAKVLEEKLSLEGYKRSQKKDNDPYQMTIARLWKNSFNSADTNASKNEFYNDWKAVEDIKNRIISLNQTNKRISSEEFLNVMKQLQAVCLKYNITQQDLLSFQSVPDKRYFVGEKIYVPYPVAGQSSFSKAIKQEVADTLNCIAQISVGSIPVVGNAISLYEVLTGKNFFTATQLSSLDRTIACFGVFIGSGKIWRTVAAGIEKELASETVVKVVHSGK